MDMLFEEGCFFFFLPLLQQFILCIFLIPRQKGIQVPYEYTYIPCTSSQQPRGLRSVIILISQMRKPKLRKANLPMVTQLRSGSPGLPCSMPVFPTASKINGGGNRWNEANRTLCRIYHFLIAQENTDWLKPYLVLCANLRWQRQPASQALVD